MVKQDARSNTKPVVGILSLQGDFEKHRETFESLGADTREVRVPLDLNGLSGLVIPGGESTAMTKLMSPELRAALHDFVRVRPVWGTCAGMIMLSKDTSDPRVQPLSVMDMDVDRNGFGRQVHSFEADLRVSPDLGQPDTPLHGVFIRAPRLRGFSPDVTPLVWLNEEPVCVRQANRLASSFHPELTGDTRLHRYFLSMLS